MSQSKHLIPFGIYAIEPIQAFLIKALQAIRLSCQSICGSWLQGRSVQSFLCLFLVGTFLSVAIAACSGSTSATKANVKLRLVSFSVTKAAHD